MWWENGSVGNSRETKNKKITNRKDLSFNLHGERNTMCEEERENGEGEGRKENGDATAMRATPALQKLR